VGRRSALGQVSRQVAIEVLMANSLKIIQKFKLEVLKQAFRKCQKTFFSANANRKFKKQA